jgi:NDP-sugar pyrophosphorylase family protein
MQAMILAAGKGERLKPFTNDRPKALATINGIPLLEIILRRLKYCGFNEVIINVHHLAGMILGFLRKNKDFGMNILISDESNLLLDTGGALKKASALIDDNQPLLIHNVDVVSTIDLAALYEYHRKSSSLVTLAVKKRISSRYFLFDGNNRLCGWKNVATGEVRWVGMVRDMSTELAFSGIHIVGPLFFQKAFQSQCFPVQLNRFSIIDVYLCLANHYVISGYDYGDAFWLDLGRQEDLQRAGQVFDNLKLY